MPPEPPKKPLPPHFVRPPEGAVPGSAVEFLNRRLEALEKELAFERERAHSAQQMLQQQDALKLAVESQLKSMSEQIRREKIDRENSEMKSHAQGRVDSLEKRLDEMHQSWVSLLKEAMLSKEPRAPQAPAMDLSALENSVKQMIEKFSSNVQNHLVESEKRLAEEMERRKESSQDSLIAGLQQDNRDIMKGLKERLESMRAYVAERREIEQSLGGSLLEAHRELSAEREKGLAALRQVADHNLEMAVLQDRLEAAKRVSAEKDARYAALLAEKDEVTRSLIAEDAKVREHIEQRRISDENWNQKIAELQKRLDQAASERAQEAAAAADLRAQVATLTHHMTKALQEKDATISQYASWEKERQDLQASLKKKEEMVAMLSTTFQNLIKKS